jgi:hypothetical protein
VDYWSRGWIVQEIILAQSIAILHGWNEYTWDELKEGALNLKKSYIQPGVYNAGRAFSLIEQKVIWDHNRQRKGSDYRLPLPKLLKSYSYIRCTDVRDKIYALLSLSNTHDEHYLHLNSSDMLKKDTIKFQVDYSRAVEETYTL